MSNERTLAGLSRQQRRAAARAARRRPVPGTVSAGAALAFGLGLSSSDVHAVDFEVTTLDDSGAGSLRQAIADANAAADADVITFQAGLTGTITLTSGQLVISRSLEIRGPGAGVLSVSGNHMSRVFSLSSGSSELDVSISGLTITNGNASEGGGINNSNENLILDGVQISGNSSSESGGGLWAHGVAMDLTVRNSTISGNVTTGSGGGVFVRDIGGPLLIQDTRITDNEANLNGGGVFLYDMSYGLTIERTTISGNAAGINGGGVFLYDTDLTGPVTVRASAITGNAADSGGGLFVYNLDAAAVIESSSIADNQAIAGDGGGIFCGTAGPAFGIRHSTLAGNSATGTGAGIALVHGPLSLSHVIVGDDAATSNADLATSGSGHFTIARSLIESPGAAAFTNSGGNILDRGGPQLGLLQNNGGPTETLLPAATSPAINAGEPSFAAPPEFDQRGSARIIAGILDIGAVERNPGSLQCSSAEVSSDERAGAVTLTVTRTGGSDGSIAVDYATANGTALAPDDFTATLGTLQWSNQEAAPKSFQVPLLDDPLVEASETFTATLSNATAGSALGSLSFTTVSISDDDFAPTITPIADQPITIGEATEALPFTIGDEDNDAGDLVVSATSSNQALVPDANLVVVQAGANRYRTVTVTPLADQLGTTDVTISVTDGANVTIETFAVIVAPPNDPPTISLIADQTIDEDTSTDAIAFMIGDANSDPAELLVSAIASNPTLLANANIVLGGSAADRTIKLTPLADQTGSTDVTITVSDGAKVTAETFALTVHAINDAPTISPVGDQTTGVNTSLDSIAFTIDDADDDPTSLMVLVTSSNEALLANRDIVLRGSGASYTLQLTPSADQTGEASVTISVTDGTDETTEMFAVVVQAASADAGIPDSGVAADAAMRRPGAAGYGSAYDDKTHQGGATQGNCGCSAVGQGAPISRSLLATLTGLFGLVAFRRRRVAPHCPR